jgi:hypothetical protein
MANIFQKMPKIKYQVDDFNFFLAPDLTIHAKLKDYIKSYRGLTFVKYIVQNGERPDQVSTKLYGRPNLDWLVMMTNDIIDPFNEWPQSDVEVNKLLIKQYGSMANAASTVVEYRNNEGYVIDRETYQTLPLGQKSRLTAVEKAKEDNRKKSHLRVLKKDMALKVEAQMLDILKSVPNG